MTSSICAKLEKKTIAMICLLALFNIFEEDNFTMFKEGIDLTGPMWIHH